MKIENTYFEDDPEDDEAYGEDAEDDVRSLID